MSNGKNKRDRPQSENEVWLEAKKTSAASLSTSILDIENFNVKKEKIQLSTDDYNNMYFCPDDSEIGVKQKSCSDKYVPSRKQDKDVICAKLYNIKGELVFLQVWDNPNGVHAKYMETLLRLVEITQIKWWYKNSS